MAASTTFFPNRSSHSTSVMKVRRRREKGSATAPTVSNAFRDAERLFKDRNSPPRISLAFDHRQIAWDDSENDDRLHGVWTSGTGERVECYRVSLAGLSESEMGQSRWKGKAKQTDEDYAIVVPRIPGELVLPNISGRGPN